MSSHLAPPTRRQSSKPRNRFEGDDEGEGSTGVGLSTRERGGLRIVSDRLKDGHTGSEVKRRTRQVGDGQVPWFDHLSLPGNPETLSLWVMQYHDDSADLQRRNSAFVEWTSQPEDAQFETLGQFVADVSAVAVGATAGDIAGVEPILKAETYVELFGSLTVRPGRAGQCRYDAACAVLLRPTARRPAAHPCR